MLWTARAAGFALHVHTVPWVPHSSCLQHGLFNTRMGQAARGCFSFGVQETSCPVSQLFAAEKLADYVSFSHIFTTFGVVTCPAPVEIYRLVFSSGCNCSHEGRSTLPFPFNFLFSDSNFSLFSAVFLWSFSFSCLLLFPSLFSF